MSCEYPGGLGPWFVALLFNTSDECKKQTHLVAHTFPHLATDILNKSSKDNKSYWIVMAKVGPFENWSQCVMYLNMWTFKTRGRKKRLERGIELWRELGMKMNLTMWTQTSERDEVLELMQNDTNIVSMSSSTQTHAPRKRKIDVKVTLNDMDNTFRDGNHISIEMIKRMQIKKIKK